MDILHSVRTNVLDVKTFGLQFLWRHAARITGNRIAKINVPNVGPVFIRVGTSDIDTVRQVFQKGEYNFGAVSPIARRMMKRYSDILESGKTPIIVDAGANIGAASLWFSKLYPRASIISIEPEPNNAVILRKNVRPGISVIEAAIGSEQGFAAVKGKGWSARTELSDQGVPIITMQDAFDCVKDGCPFIVKIDIEGFEHELFLKNTGWLSDVYSVYIELHDSMFPGQIKSGPFQREIAKHDFEIFMCGENFVYVRI